MSKQIDWYELEREERNQLIHTKVMGNPEFCDGKVVVTTANHSSSPMASSYLVWVCDKCNRMGTCNTKQEVPIQHASKDIPNYCEDLNAAWLIVEHMAKLPVERRGYHATQFMLWWKTANLWAMSAQEVADAICLEALKLSGVEVEA